MIKTYKPEGDQNLVPRPDGLVVTVPSMTRKGTKAGDIPWDPNFTFARVLRKTSTTFSMLTFPMFRVHSTSHPAGNFYLSWTTVC